MAASHPDNEPVESIEGRPANGRSTEGRRGTRYRLLALDIDGTLVNSRDELTPATCEAIRRARAADIQIVLATGRRYRRVLHLIEPLDIDVPVVTASGALIKHPHDHRTLHAATIDGDVVRSLVAEIDRWGHETVLYADTYTQGFDYYCRTGETTCPYLGEFLKKNHGYKHVWPHLVADPPANVFGGFAIGDESAMRELAERLHEALPDRLYLHVLRSPHYRGFMCEIAAAGVSKWTAICHLAADWGIAEEEICAVGDDVNDIPMIQCAGLGVAMGNALDEVKAVADRVAPAHDDDGIVQVVDWLLKH